MHTTIYAIDVPSELYPARISNQPTYERLRRWEFIDYAFIVAAQQSVLTKTPFCIAHLQEFADIGR